VRSEIREFLTTRRAKITPEQTGLRFYGRNRRVPGLRREEVALLAGISIEYYTRLERGNATGVSGDVLSRSATRSQATSRSATRPWRSPLIPGSPSSPTPPNPARPRKTLSTCSPAATPKEAPHACPPLTAHR